MKLLIWDTSSKSGALAALEWDESSAGGWDSARLVSEWSLNVDATHSERLLWGIHQTLEAARWKLEDVDVFGVGVGPGSFTGLRIGITTARTLAHSMKKPLVGVSSLAALARPAALASEPKEIIVAVTDACKGELFALWGPAKAVADCSSKSDGDQAGLWKRGVEERVIAPAELIKLLKKKGAGAHFIIVGEGGKRYPEEWKKLPRSALFESTLPFMDQISGRALGMLGWEACQGGLQREGLLVHPRYIRAPDAQLKLARGELPRGPTRGGNA